MKLKLAIITFIVAAILSGGCVEDDILIGSGAGGEEESLLRFDMQPFTVINEDGTRAPEPSANPEPEMKQEREVRDFWLFQFGQDGNQIKAAKYYSGQDLEVMTNAAYGDLAENTPMTIYIVANTGDAKWVNGAADTNFDTLEKVKKQQLRTPAVIQVTRNETTNEIEPFFIPMSGQVDNVTKTSAGKEIIVVPVTRMYAKLKIQASFAVSDMVVYDADVSNIPWYCQVSTIATELDSQGTPIAAEYPADTEWHSRALKSEQAIEEASGKWMVIYVPEVIRGESSANKNIKAAAGLNAVVEGVPDHALDVQVWAKYGGMDYYYTVYPGGNTYSDFNIQRNCVYRVLLDVASAKDQHNPSSNCFIVKSGQLLAFEPYNRVETGGGYRFEDYLNPNDPQKTISKIEIHWQTEQCIGDNTDGKLVWLGPDTKDKHLKIYVQTKNEGNAVIAARNSRGEIIWSWHIWVTNLQPDNLANAVVYRTYPWDSGGIDNKRRIPGFGVMPCNLGALAFKPALKSSYEYSGDYWLGGQKIPDDVYKTYGMLYQWGRKDPFPPFSRRTSGEYANGWLSYSDENTEQHYGNSHEKVTKSNVNNGALFHSVLGSSLTDGVKYSINNPTVYISGATSLTRRVNNPDWASWSNNGDWLTAEKSDDKLWGGLSPKNFTGKKLQVVSYRESGRTNYIYIYDNYGTEKSIFDPCPNGWRVAPGDLWLGFTKTGYNPANLSEVNYDKNESGDLGMSMFMQGSGTGSTSYFPTQGTRTVNGECYHTGHCGNYHNATCDVNNRVNILHIHNDNMHFHIFEYEYKNYFYKSTAGSVRCVRDRK